MPYTIGKASNNLKRGGKHKRKVIGIAPEGSSMLTSSRILFSLNKRIALDTRFNYWQGLAVPSTLMSLTPVIILPISYFVFKEKIGWQAILWTLLAIFGVAILFLA